MPEIVLDTVVLRVMAFAHPNGITILLAALDAPIARFPAEVYNRDEDALPLDVDDTELSELARGLRYAKQQAAFLPFDKAQRFAAWVQHATQIAGHLDRGTLLIDPLTVDELALREQYRADYGIGRGEAACLVLARRSEAEAVFLSSDEVACQAARALGRPVLTLPDVLTAWVGRLTPTVVEVDELVAGMRLARFGLTSEFCDDLRRRARAG